MVLDLVIIGLAITLMPVTILAFGLILAADKGLLKGLAFIFGWLACIVAILAVVIAITGGDPPKPNTAPTDLALAVKAVLGAVLIWFGYRQWRRMGRPHKPPNWMARLDHLSLWAAAGLGAFLLPWSLVAAAAATVVQASLSTAGDWLALALFCLLATSSFLVLELYAAFAPEAVAARLDRLRAWIDRHQDQAIVIGALLVGGWLLANSLYLLAASL
jgi:hypothetical protein